MAKIKLQHAATDQPIEVVIEQTAAGLETRVGDFRALVEHGELRYGAGWLRIDDRTLPYFAVRLPGRIDLWLDGRIHTFTTAESATRGRTRMPHGGYVGEITAPMPGTIIALKVAAGSRFAAHDPLVVMESMKMETTLSAHAPGRVAEVRCQVGQLVEMNAVLLRLEPADE